KIAQLTPHQLLTHTAGIIDEAPMYGDHDDSALGRTIRTWKGDQLFTEPGKIISYSNPGYWLAGFVVETVSKKPFADQMSESIFKPLGMTRTTFRPTTAMTYPLAQRHNSSGQSAPSVARPIAGNSATSPAGPKFTHEFHLSRFGIVAIQDGRVRGERGVGPPV